MDIGNGMSPADFAAVMNGNRGGFGGGGYGGFGDGGNSYRRGRNAMTGRFVSRDSMPQFDAYSDHRFYDANTARSANYSGHSIKDRMVAQLEQMYDDAQTEHERHIVDTWMRRIRNE